LTIWGAADSEHCERQLEISFGVGRTLSTLLIWLHVFSNRRFEAKRVQTSNEQFRAVEHRYPAPCYYFDKRQWKAVPGSEETIHAQAIGEVAPTRGGNSGQRLPRAIAS
jgi:hypothetical protein